MATRSILISFAFALLTTSASAETLPYLYPRSAFGATGTLAIELETAVGTRDAAPFGSDGFENGLRLRQTVTDRLVVEAWTGTLHSSDRDRQTGLALEAFYGVLGSSSSSFRWSLGAGYARDFRDDHVLRLRSNMERRLAPWRLNFLAHAEIPFASDRDKADIIMGVATARSLGSLHLGMEILGEDLEGFWDDQEAEGGARLVMGPTLSAPVGDALAIKANVAGIIQATRNAIPDPNNPGGVIEPESHGLLARVAMAYSF